MFIFIQTKILLRVQMFQQKGEKDTILGHIMYCYSIRGVILYPTSAGVGDPLRGSKHGTRSHETSFNGNYV